MLVQGRWLPLSIWREQLQELTKREGKLKQPCQLHCQRRANHAQKKMVAVLDKFDEDIIRILIYNFHGTQKQRPALSALPPLIRDNTSFEGGRKFSVRQGSGI